MQITRILVLAFLVLGLSSQSSRGSQDVDRKTDAFRERQLHSGSHVIRQGKLCFGSDGTLVAYVARKVNKEVLVRGGIEGEEFDTISCPVSSDDGRHVAYIATKGKNIFAFLDGRKEGPYQGWVTIPPTISNDGKRLGYGITRSEKDGSAFVVLDGVESEKYDEITTPVFGPDAKEVAYIAKKDNRQCVVSGSGIGSSYSSIRKLKVGRAGQGVAYIGSTGGKEYVVINERRTELPGSSGIDFILGQDWALLGFTVVESIKTGKVSLYMKGNKIATLDRIHSLVVAGKADQYAFVGRENARDCVWLNGIRGDARFEAIYELVLSDDGQTMAFWAVDGDDTFVMLGSKRGEGFDVDLNPPGLPSKRGPYLSQDGKRAAYGVIKGKEVWWKVLARD